MDLAGHRSNRRRMRPFDWRMGRAASAQIVQQRYPAARKANSRADLLERHGDEAGKHQSRDDDLKVCHGKVLPYARSRTLLTDFACHCPPRAVATPRAFSAAAISRNVVAPAFCASRMIGRTFAANRSASADRA